MDQERRAKVSEQPHCNLRLGFAFGLRTGPVEFQQFPVFRREIAVEVDAVNVVGRTAGETVRIRTLDQEHRRVLQVPGMLGKIVGEFLDHSAALYFVAVHARQNGNARRTSAQCQRFNRSPISAAVEAIPGRRTDRLVGCRNGTRGRVGNLAVFTGSGIGRLKLGHARRAARRVVLEGSRQFRKAQHGPFAAARLIR